MGFQAEVSIMQQNRIFVWVWSLFWQKGKTELGLGETTVLDLCKKLGNTYYMLFFGNIFILQHWLRNLSIREYTALIHFEVTGELWLLWKKLKIWKEVISIFNMPITLLFRNGLIIVEWQWLVHVLRNVIKYQQLHIE